VTAVVLTFVSAVASNEEESVLNAVQLLWVNLIMDTFAALALATDPPTPSILNRKPDRKSAPLITLRMAKMIIGQAICQLVITFVLNFAPRSMLGYDAINDPEGKHHGTLVFNTFVWLQIFNELNNRRLDNKLNIFEGITHNYFFIIINLIMVGGQVLIIFVGGQAFRIVPLTGKEWGMSIGLGAISIPFGACIRLLPDSWVNACLPAFIRRIWEPKTEVPPPIDKPQALEEGKEGKEEVGSVEFGKPLRVLTSIRGERASKNIHRNFREYMHEQKVHIKEKTRGGSKTGSKTDVVAGT
jgi:Ca2+-transporting ATPase